MVTVSSLPHLLGPLMGEEVDSHSEFQGLVWSLIILDGLRSSGSHWILIRSFVFISTMSTIDAVVVFLVAILNSKNNKLMFVDSDNRC